MDQLLPQKSKSEIESSAKLGFISLRSKRGVGLGENNLGLTPPVPRRPFVRLSFLKLLKPDALAGAIKSKTQLLQIPPTAFVRFARNVALTFNHTRPWLRLSYLLSSQTIRLLAYEARIDTLVRGMLSD